MPEFTKLRVSPGTPGKLAFPSADEVNGIVTGTTAPPSSPLPTTLTTEEMILVLLEKIQHTSDLADDAVVLTFRDGTLRWVPSSLFIGGGSETFNVELEDGSGSFLLEDASGFIVEEA